MSQANLNRSTIGNLSAILDERLREFGLDLENNIPVVVESYDRNENVLIAFPAINVPITDGSYMQRDVIKVSCALMFGGNMIMSFPIKKGDTGWIIGGDRDTSLFKQNLQITNPNTLRLHKFQFGFFIPDKVKGYTISEEDADAVVIQSLDGSTKISAQPGKVKIVATDVEVDCTNLTGTCSSATLDASTSVVVTVPTMTVNGNLLVSGSISAGTGGGGSISMSGGTIVADGDVQTKGGALSVNGHVHTGVQSGGSNTGGAV